MNKTFFASVLLVFSVLTGVFFWLNTAMPDYNFSVLMTGNVIMLILSVVTFVMVSKQSVGNSAAFLRGVYGSTFLKLFICMIGIVGYALINKPNVHKPTLFVLLGIYAIYSIVENAMLSRIVRKIK